MNEGIHVFLSPTLNPILRKSFNLSSLEISILNSLSFAGSFSGGILGGLLSK